MWKAGASSGGGPPRVEASRQDERSRAVLSNRFQRLNSLPDGLSAACSHSGSRRLTGPRCVGRWARRRRRGLAAHLGPDRLVTGISRAHYRPAPELALPSLHSWSKAGDHASAVR
jgi:hypothetical protein